MSERIRVAIAGLGRGSHFFPAFRSHPATEIVALCDPDEGRLAEAAKATGAQELYTVYEKMLDRARPDAVVVATPMHLHAEHSIAALQRDIHVLAEVTAAVNMNEARWLVRACQRTRAVYMMAENCNRYKSCMLVEAMVSAGLFGEVYYVESEYLHPLPFLHHTPEGRPTWRYYWHVGINGHTYPTHSLGPCLQWMRERPERLSCIGSGRWSDLEHDIEDTILVQCKTSSGKLIHLRGDLLSRRPFSLNWALQGTKGAYEGGRGPGARHWVWLEGYSRDPEEWLPLESFEAEFLPELWRNPPPEAADPGPGGSTYFTVLDFVAAVQGLCPPTIGIHQAMDMTLPGLVSQESIRRGGEWLPVPNSRDW